MGHWGVAESLRNMRRTMYNLGRTCLLLALGLMPCMIRAEPPVLVTESVRVWAGSSTVLRCRQDPGDQLVMVTWKVQLLDNSHCTLALNWENLTNRNNCSERMRQENTSLRIENTAVTDQGNYTCETANPLGNFFTSVLLDVLVQPSVTLELNKLGVPECRAHGGNPAANISWIPEGSISTNRAMEPDRSWTVSSTYTATSSNVTQVTCIVSHPTFPQPYRTSISTAGSDMWKFVTIPLIIVLIVGLILRWKRRQIRYYYRRGLKCAGGTEEQVIRVQ
ncbi:hypothetical protein XENTR_v10004757 [Xenopus tropicalis]|nr:hypothetical protein XENTR_v10004757 [Xenopus tropicalis]